MDTIYCMEKKEVRWEELVGWYAHIYTIDTSYKIDN